MMKRVRQSLLGSSGDIDTIGGIGLIVAALSAPDRLRPSNSSIAPTIFPDISRLPATWIDDVLKLKILVNL